MNDAYHFANYNPQTLARYDSVQLLRGDLNFVDENGRQSLVGAFLQDAQRFGPLEVTAGVRMDYTYTEARLPGFERQELSYFSPLPRAAVAYRTPLDSTLKLMYGRAFRTPSLSDLTISHDPVVAGGLATQNTLRPEIVDTGELAYTQNVLSKLSLTATTYLSYAKDLLTPGPALTPADECFPVCSPGRHRSATTASCSPPVSSSSSKRACYLLVATADCSAHGRMGSASTLSRGPTPSPPTSATASRVLLST